MTAPPDIIWFLLDGMRPDRLQSCGGDVRQRLFIDEVLESGTLFTNSIAAGAYSLIALNALFTSLFATTNGVNGAYKTTAEDLHPEAVILLDIQSPPGAVYAASGVDHRETLEARPPPPTVPELSKAMNAYEG